MASWPPSLDPPLGAVDTAATADSRQKLIFDDKTRREATKTVSGLIVFLQSVPPASLNLFGEVLKLFKLLLVCPASVASAERSFSGLRRLKTWLRSSISQERLTHLAILHAHQLYVDEHAA